MSEMSKKLRARSGETERPRRDYRQLQRIIAGLTEGVILVGKNRRIIWANDAALSMHGVARIDELGRTPAEYRGRFELCYRNSHKLEPEQYPIDRVMAGGAFEDITVVVARGETERSWVHTVRGLVIVDASGATECFALIVRDETERYEAEARFESAFNTNPAPALICRLSDGCFVKVNPGFLEMTGYAREEIVGRPLAELDVLVHGERHELAQSRFAEGRTIPQMESRVPLPGGAHKFVIVAGEPIWLGEEACILFTFADLDPRKKVEQSLRQSEERFAKSFRLSPAPSVICRLDGLVLSEINEAFAKISSYSESELIGRSFADLSSDRTTERQLERLLATAGGVSNFDFRLRAKDEALIDCLLSTVIVTINDEACGLFVTQDITERKRSETELIGAIEAVMADTSWFSRAIVEKLAALRRSASALPLGAELHELSRREKDVLGLICEGRSDKEMSAVLKLSPNTIRNHIASLYEKIGVRRRAAAVIWGRERGVTGFQAARRVPGN
jgi:PAS domain S-box-containing protein